MTVIIDAMGGDNAPDAVVEGVLMASRLTEHKLVLVGNPDVIKESIAKFAKEDDRIPVIIGASEVIGNDESPTRAVRTKKDSSINVGMNILKDGFGDVFISAGSTGALLVSSLFTLGRIKGIDRPAICSVYPVLGKEASLLVDAGANAECKPRNLLEFAVMGSIYMEKVLGRTNPKVGLVNIGSESKKGTPLTQKVYELLEESGLNFIGNVEARDLPAGACDVIVTDGFTGNVILKLTEGLGAVLSKVMKKSAQASGAAVSASASFDYSEYGGAPVLGVKKPVIKMHGSSDSVAVKNAVLKGIDFAQAGIIDIIREELDD